MATPKDLEDWFTYHTESGSQPARYVLIREGAKQLAGIINTCCQESADKSAAFRKLRECVMTANAAIALEQPLMPFHADAPRR